MPALSFHHPARGSTAHAELGFTLVELLVVLAIAAILAIAIMPSMRGLLDGLNLKGSSNILYSEFDLARQTASTRNVSVDVRLYQDSSQPLDSNGNQPYRIIAVVISALSSGASSDEFVGAPMALQGDVIVDSSTTFSSLLNTSLLPTSPAPTATEATTAPFIVRGKTYVRFLFLPNGSMNLTTTTGSSTAWTLTLVNQRGKAATVSGAPAANYITFVLDAPTGRARVYQP